MMRLAIIALCGLGFAFGATIVSQRGDAAVEMHSKNAPTIDPFRMPVNGSTPTGWIQVGTPKKWLYVIFDTGSDKLVAKTWDTVANELADVDQGVDGLVQPSTLLYNHDGSSTYHRRFRKDPESEKMVPEQYTITYGSGTAITDLGEDKVFVGRRSLENFTLMEITKDNLQMLHTSKGIAGILGLQHMKNRSLGHSFFSRLRDAGEMTSFGYCHGSSNNGTFIWGDDSTEGTASEVFGEMHWAVHLSHVQVEAKPEEAGNGSLVEALAHSFPKQAHKIKQLNSNMLTEIIREIGEDIHKAMQDPSGVDIVKKIMGAQGKDKLTDAEKKKIADIVDKVFGHQNDSQEAQDNRPDRYCSQGCTGILDTGSNIIAGPRGAISEITRTVNIEPDCSNFDSLPSISMNFGGQVVIVEPHGYVMKVPVPENGWENQDGEAAGSGQDPDSQDGAGSGQDPSSQDATDSGQDPSMEANGFRTIQEHGEESDAGLAETQSSHDMKGAFGSRWNAAFEYLNKVHGIDLTDQLGRILDKLIHKGSEPKEMCMSALVPIDQQTVSGPLWIVGTPLLDSYYARWSFEQDAERPQIHLKALKDADVCKEPSDAEPKKTVMRSEKMADSEEGYASHRNHQFGPQRITMRKLEEIAFPHWAKTLSKV